MGYMSQERIELIEQLEYIVGKNCYNKHTYNYDGTNGRTYRYPVHMKDPENGYANYIYSNGQVYGADSISIGTLRYEFGANALYIGDALNEILDYLEERYNIDFDDL